MTLLYPCAAKEYCCHKPDTKSEIPKKETVASRKAEPMKHLMDVLKDMLSHKP